MANNDKTYRMSFTTGGLFKSESLIAVRLYLESHDWNAVKAAILQDNLFQLNTLSGQKRTWSEVHGRLEEMSEQELELYVKSDSQQQGYFIWLSLCRHYPFIGEFALSVIVPKFQTYELQIARSDFERYWEAKLLERPALASITTSTYQRLRSGFFTFLKGCGITDEKGLITPVCLSSELFNLLKEKAPDELYYFPLVGMTN